MSIFGDHKMISRIKKVKLVRGNDEVEIHFDFAVFLSRKIDEQEFVRN